MKKVIIIVFLYVIFAYATGMSVDNGELAISTRSGSESGKSATVKIALNSIGTVDFRLGELSVKHTGAKEYVDCDEEDKIFALDTLTTGEESKCEIILNDGSTIRISEKSQYVFESYTDKPNIAYVGNLLKGESWTNVNKSDKNARDFKVKSPIAVAAVVGTSYKMTSDGQMTNIAVREGQVNVDLEQQVKTKYNIIPPKKSNSMAPKEVGPPKEVPGPYEVTLNEWISIVKGEVISVRYDGRYNKFKTDIEQLEREWQEFMNSKK
ncbi:MAG: FecR domain-containing protein [Candidatus Delongbacteria bacterium]|nr:FecR domain-containing protein [Candidatus Delongbacteria bacterium]